MRNLKKILALVLALVMSLSLVTIANAADFTDNDDISYEEAADVMNAIGIIEGFEDGSFDPNGTLTREQAATLVTRMLLGDNADRLGVEGSTFNDVAATRWSASYIEYCAGLGLIDGAGDGNFYPAGQLTANAFAKILLTALGYSSEKEGMTGTSWSVNVAALAMDVGLDDGIEDLSWNAVLTREEAAQMALNAICAPLVAYDNDATITVNGAEVSIGSGDAYYVTTTLAREQRISTQRLSNTDEYTVEFGERYFPNLRLASDPDEFNRPCHTWVYGNEEIGSYVDYDLLVETYTTGVTGQDLYNLLGRSTIADYEVYYYVDGAEDDTIATSNMIRTNNREYDTTGNGVLTQVFVDHNANDGEGEITITSINTWLAQVDADYNERNETLSLTVYDGLTGNTSDEYAEEVTIDDVSGIEDYQEGDFVLVNMAAIGARGRMEVVRVMDPEVMSDVEITRFSKGNYVTVDGEQYDYAATNFYKDDVLRSYNDNDQLTNYTYIVYLDQYGYAIGVDEFEGQASYLFLTGYDRPQTHLGIKTAEAGAIFLDGTMSNIEVNVSKTNKNIEDYNSSNYVELKDYEADNSQSSTWMSRYNRWFTYTVNGDGVYTLTPADNWLNVRYDADRNVINSASVRLNGDVGENRLGSGGVDDNRDRAYGNDDSVYILVGTSGNDYAHSIIDDVNAVYTGVQNVDIEIAADTADNPVGESVFAVYDEDLYVIGAVVIGEDVNNTQNYAYGIDNEAMNEYVESDDDYYYWDFEAVVDGHVETLTVKDAYGDVIDRIQDYVKIGEGAMLELTYDADGYVVDALVCVDTVSDSEDETADNVYSNGENEVRDINSGSNTDNVYVVDVVDEELFTTGRTLFLGDADDYGVTIASGAPVIVIQREGENGDYVTTVEEYSSISSALNAMADSDYNGASDDIREFRGQIGAVLNDNGTAEYLVFNSDAIVGVELDDGTSHRSDVDEVKLDANGNINLYDRRGTHLTSNEERDYELWQYSAGQNGYVKVDEGTYRWGVTPALNLTAGSSYYVVIDGVESNIVRK